MLRPHPITRRLHFTGFGTFWGFIAGGVVPMVALSEESEMAPEPHREVIASRIPAAEPESEREHFTGDWFGLRTKWRDHGFHFSSGYAAEVFGNVSGGIKRGAVYQGLLELGLEVDPSVFSSWPGAKFNISALYPHGASPSGQLVGDLSTVSNIDAYDSFLLYEWWLEQRFLENALAIRAGQLAADEDFAISDYASAFLNATFGWPSFISINAPAPAYPVAALGARIRWDVRESLYFQAAVYDGNPDPGNDDGDPINPHGTDLRLSQEEGVLVMAEAGLTPHTDGAMPLLPGLYKVGAWFHTADFDHLREDENGLSLADPMSTGVPKRLNDNWGVYVMGDQMVWRESSGGGEDDLQGLGVFVRLGSSPSDRSLVSFNFEAGFHYQGLLPDRDEDIFAIGVDWLNMSDEAARLSRETGEPELDHEFTLEATYQIHVRPWWVLQPDVQFILHPGGSSALSNALVLGLRSSLTF